MTQENTLTIRHQLRKFFSNEIILARSLFIMGGASCSLVLVISSMHPNLLPLDKWGIIYLFIFSYALFSILSFKPLNNKKALDIAILGHTCALLSYFAYLNYLSNFDSLTVLIFWFPLFLCGPYFNSLKHLSFYFAFALVSYSTATLCAPEPKIPVHPMVGVTWSASILLTYFWILSFKIQSHLNLTKREKELSSKQFELDLILDTMTAVVSIKDENGVFVKANKEFCKFSGYTQEELIGKTVFDFLPYELASRYHSEDLEILKARLPVLNLQEQVRNAQGELRWRRTTKLPYRDPISGFNGVLIFAEDITDIVANTKRLEDNEASLRDYAVQLERSNRRLEEFAYAASHDLREPLRTVMSFTQILKRRLDNQLTPELEEYMGFITQGTERMDLLIKGLLEYSRVGNESVYNEIDIADILEIVTKNLSKLIYDNQAEIIIPAKLPILMANKIELSNVFQNLISNAIKYRGTEKPNIKINYILNGNFHEFGIADNGLGINPEDYEQIFEVFHRLHSYENIPGAGIGLSICKKVIERHGGRIWIESTFGAGTTFYFSLPVNKPETANP